MDITIPSHTAQHSDMRGVETPKSSYSREDWKAGRQATLAKHDAVISTPAGTSPGGSLFTAYNERLRRHVNADKTWREDSLGGFLRHPTNKNTRMSYVRPHVRKGVAIGAHFRRYVEPDITMGRAAPQRKDRIPFPFESAHDLAARLYVEHLAANGFEVVVGEPLYRDYVVRFPKRSALRADGAAVCDGVKYLVEVVNTSEMTLAKYTRVVLRIEDPDVRLIAVDFGTPSVRDMLAQVYQEWEQAETPAAVAAAEHTFLGILLRYCVAEKELEGLPHD